MGNNSITLLSKTDPSLEEAVLQYKDEIHYCGEIINENYNYNIDQFPIGTEIYTGLFK